MKIFKTSLVIILSIFLFGILESFYASFLVIILEWYKNSENAQLFDKLPLIFCVSLPWAISVIYVILFKKWVSIILISGISKKQYKFLKFFTIILSLINIISISYANFILYTPKILIFVAIINIIFYIILAYYLILEIRENIKTEWDWENLSEDNVVESSKEKTKFQRILKVALTLARARLDAEKNKSSSQ